MCGLKGETCSEAAVEDADGEINIYWGRWSGYSSGPHIKIATYQLSLFPTLAFNISNSSSPFYCRISGRQLYTTTTPVEGRFMGRMLTLADRWAPLKPFYSTIIYIYCQPLLFHHLFKLYTLLHIPHTCLTIYYTNTN